MGRAARALMALVVAAMLVLSGCASQSPRDAATINGSTITVADLEAMQPVLEPYLQVKGAQSVLNMLILTRIGTEIVNQQKLTFSDAERSSAAAGVPAELAKDPKAAGFVADYTSFVLATSRLGQEGFIKAAGEQSVEVNPRFGTWDATQLSLANSGSLSSPAPLAKG